MKDTNRSPGLLLIFIVQLLSLKIHLNSAFQSRVIAFQRTNKPSSNYNQSFQRLSTRCNFDILSVRSRVKASLKTQMNELEESSNGLFRRLFRKLRAGRGSFDGGSVLSKVGAPGGIRGSNYGTENNSTIPTPEQVAQKLGVKPTKEASVKTWRRAYRLHKRSLSLLHSMDSCRPPDSSLNLVCIWWKALAGNDISSPVYDDGLSYDLLPSGFRLLVNRRMVGLYPRLHHSNVEYRTAFLDQAISNVLDKVRKSGNSNYEARTETKVRLICFGAGYDIRTIKFLEKQKIDRAYELDLPYVLEAKKSLLGSKRLLKRRPHLSQINMPKLIPSDLNDLQSLKASLTNIIGGNDADQWHNIFVFEGVMIYLDEGIPSSLLKLTSSVLKEEGALGSLCFADRLENVHGGDYDKGVEEMAMSGWDLDEWCPKPGLARHMGSATLI